VKARATSASFHLITNPVIRLDGDRATSQVLWTVIRPDAAGKLEVAMFGRLAEIAAEYLRKGSQVYVEGKLRTRKWQDKEGKDRWTTEIVADEMHMLGGKGGGAAAGAAAPSAAAAGGGGGSGRAAVNDSGAPPGDFDDDIPFNAFGTVPFRTGAARPF
jgi:hypothetical protein